MKFVSLFAGIGGFDLALERLGHECVYANDFDKYCKIIYDKNFGGSVNVPQVGGGEETQKGVTKEGEGLHAISSETTIHQDGWNYEHINRSSNKRQFTILDNRSITEVSTSEIPDHDLLVGGFPCQAFSIAGKRGGFSDTRGTLFFEVARILRDKRPRYFILENVKGLLSHDSGKTFQTILGVLTDLGYDYQWQVLNSKNFGVPQNRERVFIVGNIRGVSRPEVFPFRETNPKTLKYVGGILSEKTKKWLDDGKEFSRNFPQGSRVYNADGLATTLASQAGGLGAKTGLYVARVNRKEKVFDMRKTETTGALTATMYKGIDASGRTGVIEGTKIRKLTPRECERLQGFPDDWTEGCSDTQRYKMLGNAVTVNVVEAVASKLPLVI